jgi:hypothetical protein
MKRLSHYFDVIDARVGSRLPIVRTIEAADLTPAEMRALESVGYRAPLSVRIGRGPLHSVVGAVRS